MAQPQQRYKLKLTSLKFLSLVDTPAQQTATFRLAKRAGAEGDEIEATFKIAKVGTGDSPLIHGWAFTCTDETGAAYHDLQGDAITADFIKAAEDWLASGGAVDEMHNEVQTAKIAFCYPLDADVIAALIGKEAGAATKISGLAAAVRPTAEQLAKIRAGDYTGFSIQGTGVREAVKSAPADPTAAILNVLRANPAAVREIFDKAKKKPKRRAAAMATPDPAGSAGYKRVGKIAVLTSVTDGHQHTVDLEDPACSYSDSLSTSYQTAEGATEGHSHAWVYDAATGAITIALDSGHTHTVTAVVPAEVIAEAAADDDTDAAPCAVCDEPSAATPTVVVAVTSRAPGISPPAEATPTVKNTEEPIAMPDQNDKIADLEKRLADAEKRATLSDAQRVFLKTLEGTDAAQFLSLTSPQRDIQIAEVDKANTVVYESPFTKRVYRMNDSLELIEMAKAADSARTREAEAEKREAIAKYAERGRETLTHFAKGTKGDLRTRFMRMLDNEFSVPAEYEEAVKALKGANHALILLGEANGVNPHVDPLSVDAPPIEKFNAARVEFAKAKFKTDAPSDAQLRSVTGEFIKTAKGAELYAEQSNRAQA